MPDDYRMTPATMRAERPWPQPVDDEVLARVHAADVDPVNYTTKRDVYPFVTPEMLSVVMGRSLAGATESLGHARTKCGAIAKKTYPPRIPPWKRGRARRHRINP